MGLDWQLIRNQLKKGDNSVLEVLYSKYGEYCIKRLVKYNQCNREEAMDIFVDCIMSLREKLIANKIDDLIKVKEYLYRSCYNTFLNGIKDQNRKSDYLKEYYYKSSYLESDSFDMEEMMRITRDSWKSISERCKDILYYFYVEKMNMNEISEVLGLSNADVAKTTKFRCYQNLMKAANRLRGQNEILNESYGQGQ